MDVYCLFTVYIVRQVSAVDKEYSHCQKCQGHILRQWEVSQFHKSCWTLPSVELKCDSGKESKSRIHFKLVMNQSQAVYTLGQTSNTAPFLSVEHHTALTGVKLPTLTVSTESRLTPASTSSRATLSKPCWAATWSAVIFLCRGKDLYYYHL